MIANVWEIDELPFLKTQRFKQNSSQQIRLLESIRGITFSSASIMAKIFLFQQQLKKDSMTNKFIKQLIVYTQQQLYPLKDFYQIMRETMKQQEFSNYVNEIMKFEQKCKKFLKETTESRQIEFIKKEFLTFGLYMIKQQPSSTGKQSSIQKPKQLMLENKFYIKCSFSNFQFKASMQMTTCEQECPQPFEIQDKTLIECLIKRYLHLQSFPLPVIPTAVERYLKTFDQTHFMADQEYLKLQVYKNYPLLRVKYFLPIRFNDPITKERLDGLIFSNADQDCMYAHFTGYNADTTKNLQGNHCQECRIYIDQVQQNSILTYLRDNIFNPCKQDVLFCPQFNRFKIMKQTLTQEADPIPQNQDDIQLESPIIKKIDIVYLNYLHMRANVKRFYTKKRVKFEGFAKEEKFNLSFSLWNKKLLISDPVRGKNCTHYGFTDLRVLYLNKVTQSKFECPICQQIIADSQILYLREVEILFKYLKHKTNNQPKQYLTGICYISHQSKRVCLQYTKNNKGSKETEILQIQKFYATLIDPFTSFAEYTLRIPDQYEQKMKRKYMFGIDQQSESQKYSSTDFDPTSLEHQTEQNQS